jgi:membrane protease YdiL (CAAX protease family)
MDTTAPARWWLWFLLGFLLLWGTLTATAALDSSGRLGPVALAAVLAAAVLIERARRPAGPREMLRRLGLGRPSWRALGVAGLIGALILLVYPVLAALTGSTIGLQADWPWLVVAVFALHGLAEELVWRGYAFRRLRAGRTFREAVLWTMPLIAATHLPIVLSLGPTIGLGAMVVAAITSLPLAYLYEVGRRTIWAPAIVHTAIDSFKLVVIPAGTAATLSLLLIAVSIVVPLLALGVPRGWFEAGTGRSGAGVQIKASS